MIGSNSKFKKFKKTWIERCHHLCVCPLIDHRREPIRMQELLGLLYNNYWMGYLQCKETYWDLVSVHKLESKIILLNQIKVLKDMIKQFLPLCLFLEKKKNKRKQEFYGYFFKSLSLLGLGLIIIIWSHPLSVKALFMGIWSHSYTLSALFHRYFKLQLHGLDETRNKNEGYGMVNLRLCETLV